MIKLHYKPIDKLDKRTAAYVADHYADYWVTQDKLVCSIDQLATRHLLHIVTFMQRRVESKRFDEMIGLARASCILSGEHALDAVNSEMDLIGQLDKDEYLDRDPRYVNLVKELKRRGYNLDESNNAWPRQFVLDLTGGSTHKRARSGRRQAAGRVFGPHEDGLMDPYHGVD